MFNNKILLIGGGVALVFIIGLILVFTLGGKKKTNPSANGPVVLNLWSTVDEKTAIDPVISIFQEKNPNVKINYVVKNKESFLTDSINEIAAGSGPDIWVVPNDWLPQYHDKMVALKETVLANKKQHKDGFEVFKETFPDVVAQNTIVNNKIYGIPLTINSLALYYNSQILSNIQSELDFKKELSENDKLIFRNGPRTWDELIKLVKWITKKDNGKITQSAITLGTADNVQQSVDILTLLMMQNGAKMVADDLGSAQFQTDQNLFSDIKFPGVKALEFYNSFADKNSPNYTWNDSLGNSRRAFVEGKVAMMIDYQDAEKELKLINPQFINYQKLNVPQINETKNPVDYTSYQIFTVTKASKNPDTAWDFILTLTNNIQNVNYYASLSKNTPALNVKGDTASPINSAKTWFKPDPEKTDEIFKEMIRQANKGLDIPTAVQGAASQITTLLGKINKN